MIPPSRGRSRRFALALALAAFCLCGAVVIAQPRPGGGSTPFPVALLQAILRRDGLDGYANWTGRDVAYDVLLDSRPLLDEFEARRVAQFVQSRAPRVSSHSRPASLPDGSSADVVILFRRLCKGSPAVGADVYDRTLKEALVCHFVRRDFAKAIELYSQALDMAEEVLSAANEADLIPSPARSSSYRVWFSALSRGGGIGEHRQGIAKLVELARAESAEWKRPSKAPRTIPGWVRTRAPVYKTDGAGGVLLDCWIREIVEQALIADIWCDDRESEDLYQLADSLLQTQIRLPLETMRRLAERTGIGRSDSLQTDSPSVVMRSWLEPGFIAIYSSTLTDALRDAYYVQDAESASCKLEVLLRLSRGPEGSASLDHQNAIAKARSRLATCEKAR
jgi:hypothetical protein